MRARDIMTSEVVTVGPATPVREVADLLAKHRISAVPVVDAAGLLVGIVSEGDLFCRPEGGTERRYSWLHELFASPETMAREYVKTHGIRTADVMTTEVATIEEDTPIADIADLLARKRVKRVPVLRDGKLVGIVSRADLVRAAFAGRPTPAPAPGGDDAIEADIRRSLGAVPWINPWLVNVEVQDGKATLTGLVSSPEQMRAASVLAEAVPGVKSVQNRMMQSRHRGEF